MSNSQPATTDMKLYRPHTSAGAEVTNVYSAELNPQIVGHFVAMINPNNPVSGQLVALAEYTKSVHLGRCVIVGVSGCQGSGKTYSTNSAVKLLEEQGIRADALSLDDFYVSNQEQTAIASRGNRLLQKRGLPGTHDVQLMHDTLVELKRGGHPKVPVYDKSQHAGAGDRVGMRDLPTGLQVVFFEGWFTGFSAIGPAKIHEHREAHDDHTRLYSLAELEEVDTSLEDYSKVWDTLDVLFYMRPQRLDFVCAWRQQQEHQLISEKGQGMTDKEVEAFVGQYMPVYDLYSDSLKYDSLVVLGFDRKAIQSSEDLERRG